MRILGLDPGLAVTGWGFLDSGSNGNAFSIHFGNIKTGSADPFTKRLLELFRNLKKVIRKERPESIALEEIYFPQYARTITATAQARGVILLAAAQSELPIFEYNPREVKQVIAANGNATKIQIQRMTQKVLNLPEIPQPDDAADALAVAYCHWRVSSSQKVHLQ